MKFHADFLFYVILVAISVEKSDAQTCCSGGVPVSGNIGLFPGKGATFQWGLNYDYNLLTTLKDNSVTLSSSDRKRLTNSFILENSYSFSDKLSLYTMFSFVNQTREINSDYGNDVENSQGLGDMVVMPGYLIMNNHSFAWFLSAGIKLPIGKTNIRNEDNILLNADLQPGSGAYDFLFFNMFKTLAGKGNSFSHQFAFRKTGTNRRYREDDSYQFGNELHTSIGWSNSYYILSNIVESAFSLSYRWAGKDILNSYPIPNTGGNWIFANPGISLYPVEKFRLNIGAGIPIFSQPEGVQLSTTIRINLGMLYTFGENKIF